eukprot:3067473-Rhodomonas_salina.1
MGSSAASSRVALSSDEQVVSPAMHDIWYTAVKPMAYHVRRTSATKRSASVGTDKVYRSS